MVMILIRFPSTESKRLALACLAGQFAFNSWAAREMLVPEDALMADIIGTITGLIGLARKGKEAADALKDSDMKMHIAHLLSDLADLKVKCADLVTENNQ